METYKLDLVKTGVILQGLRSMRKMSRTFVAESIGVTNDVIRNIEKGLGGVTLERAIKLCALYEMPIIALVLLILKDADIDFRDRILVYDHKNDDVTPITDESVPEVPGVLPESVVEAAESIEADSTAPTHGVVLSDPQAVLDAVIGVHGEHIADLHAEIARQDQTIRQLIELLGR